MIHLKDAPLGIAMGFVQTGLHLAHAADVGPLPEGENQRPVEDVADKGDAG